MVAREPLEPHLHPFFSGYFGGRVSLFVQLAWTMIFLFFKLPVIAGMTGMCHSTQLLVEMGISLLASNCNPLYLSFLSSWDYRHEPPAPSSI
jgi:hypothetical protein